MKRQPAATPGPARRSLFRKLADLAWADRLLLGEALGLLALARLMALLLPFRRVAAWLGESGAESPRELPPGQEAVARRVGWAVAACAPRVPWNGKCLTQAIAAWMMLTRRGIPGTVYLGVGQDPRQPGRKCFHAWLRCGRRAVTGGDGHHYLRLGCFSRTAGPHA